MACYFQALGARDFRAARTFLSDDFQFEGPIDRFDRADDYIKAISALYGMVKGVEHQAAIAQGEIVRIRTYFDARSFARPSPTQG